MQLKNLSNDKLIEDLKAFRAQERGVVTNILKYLLEVESRGLHLQRRPSIYEFCMEELGYSEDEAYIRVQAMRCLKAIPAIEEKIEAGKLSLSVVAKAQTVFRRQAKLKKALSVQQKNAVIDSLLNVSVRQAEKKLAAAFPESDLPREKIKPLSDELTSYQFVANKQLNQKLETLKHLLAHKNFDGRLHGLIEAMADIALKKFENEIGNSVAQRKSRIKKPNRNTSPSRPRSRYITKAVKRAVWQRADCQCEFRDSQTGHRCSNRHGVQIDHVLEYALGGSNDIENLQLLCGAHNRWKSRSLLN